MMGTIKVLILTVVVAAIIISLLFRRQLPKLMQGIKHADPNERFKAVRSLAFWAEVYPYLWFLLLPDPRDAERIAENVHLMLHDEFPALRALSSSVIGGFGQSNPRRWITAINVALSVEDRRYKENPTDPVIRAVIEDMESAVRELRIVESHLRSRGF